MHRIPARADRGQVRMLRRVVDGYNVQYVDTGIDYLDIVRRFEAGELVAEQSFERTANRHVHILVAGGRRYVLKYRTMRIRHIESKLSRFVFGEMFSRIMRLSNRAFSQGCDFIQRVYFVAEKYEGHFSHSIALFEYIEGTPLSEEDTIQDYLPQMLDRVAELHEYGLAFCDPNPGNFIMTEDGLKVIDLSFRNSFRVCKAKDVVMLKENYGVHMPVSSIVDKLMVGVVDCNRVLRRWLKRRKQERLNRKAVAA